MIHPVVQLGDIVSEAITGFASGGRDSDGVAQVRMNNVTVDGALDLNTVIRVPTSQKQLDRHALQRGDILFNNTNSEELVGKTTLFEEFSEPITFSNHFTRIRIKPDIAEPRYVAKWIHAQFKSGALLLLANRWVNQSAIRTDKLLALHLPLPPLPDQKRIADILDRADALKRKRQEAIKLTDDFLRATFLDMFGDASSGNKWPTVRIADLCSVKGGKRLPKGTPYSEVPTPFRYIRIVDLQNGKIAEQDLKFIDAETQQRIRRYVVNEGDVVITIAGTTGMSAPVPASLDGVNLTENAAMLKPRRTDYCAEYLHAALQTESVQRQLKSKVGQVTIEKLALFRIEQVEVPMPKLELQLEFAELVAESKKIKQKQEESELELQVLANQLSNSLLLGRNSKSTNE